MYESFYGFREQPFRVTPDPRFLYRNPAIDEAMAALHYGIEQRKGFLSLVGEVGTGKTTLLRHLLDSVAPSTQTVFILYPTVQFDEMLEYILHELGIPTDGGKLVKLQRLHDFLLEHTRAGGNAAIVIDEAQDLDARVLEELRLLSNLETGTEKILQILLAGQPELERKLAQPELRQLRQRIALHVRLRVFAPAEVASYIAARLARAGGDPATFDTDAVVRIAEVTSGTPRLVNVLCDACLVAGFADGARQITRDMVDAAWSDYAHLSPAPPPAPAPEPATAAPTAMPAPTLAAHAVPRVPVVPPAPVPEPAPITVAPQPRAVPPAATVHAQDPDTEAAHAWRGRRRVAVWILAVATSLAAASVLWANGPQLLALMR
jgi:type II secretory pathway predicted ATPase ExeA